MEIVQQFLCRHFSFVIIHRSDAIDIWCSLCTQSGQIFSRRRAPTIVRKRQCYGYFNSLFSIHSSHTFSYFLPFQCQIMAHWMTFNVNDNLLAGAAHALGFAAMPSRNSFSPLILLGNFILFFCSLEASKLLYRCGSVRQISTSQTESWDSDEDQQICSKPQTANRVLRCDYPNNIFLGARIARLNWWLDMCVISC